jgi:transposase
MSKKNASQARRRAEIILRVRSGQLTASEAARILGVSRKTYYQWEKRALQGMLDKLENRDPGRPPNPEPDREKIRLEKKVADLEKRLELMAEVNDLKQMLGELRAKDPPTPKKKKASPKGPKKKR